MSGEDHASRSGGGAGSEARGGGSPGPHRAPTSSSSSTSNPFDPATLFGSSALSSAAALAGSPYAHLAYAGLLGPHPFMPPPFGGLGSLVTEGLGPPLGSPSATSSQSPLSPSTGLQGAYSSMFQLPSLSSAATTTSVSTATKSSASSGRAATKSHNSSPAAPSSSKVHTPQQSSSPTSSHHSNESLQPPHPGNSSHHGSSSQSPSTTSRKQKHPADHNSSTQKREKVRGEKERAPSRGGERPSSTSSRSSTDTAASSSTAAAAAAYPGGAGAPPADFWKNLGMPSAVEMSDPAKYAASLYGSYGGLSNSAAASLYTTQSLLGAGMYPFPGMYGMSPFGAPFHPGFSAPMPGADLGSLSPHSTSSKASSASATSKTKAVTTGQSTATTSTPSVSKATDNAHRMAPSFNSNEASQRSHDRKSGGTPDSRKKLFDPLSSLPVHNRDIPKSADTPPALTPHKPHGAAIPAQQKSQTAGRRSDSESSSDSCASDVSDSEEDKSPRKHKQRTSSHMFGSHGGADSPSVRSQPHEEASHLSSTFKRPPTPELVDLSVKRRPESRESSGSEHSGRLAASPHALTEGGRTLTDKPLDLTAPATGKSKSGRSGTSTKSAAHAPLPDSMTAAAAAAATAQQMAELFGFYSSAQGGMFNPLTAAALMPGMFDPAAAHAMMMMMPPPPSSAEVAATRGRGGRGGRGSRGGRGAGRRGGRAGAQPKDPSQPRETGRGSRGGRPPGSRRGTGRGRKGGTQHMVSLLSQQNLFQKQQEQQQQQQQQQQKNLQKQLELSLKQQQKLQKQQARQEEAERSMQSKLALALMGQCNELPPSAASSRGAATAEDPFVAELKKLSKSSAAAAKPSGDEGTSDSDSESDDSSSSSSDEENQSDTNESSRDSSAVRGRRAAGGAKARSAGDAAEQTVGPEEAPARKRRKLNLDETEIRIPLEHGWRRQTRIRGVGSRGLIGEVVYFAPCGKRLKSVPEVARYLEKNGITDLARENFTFSLRVNVGEFSEAVVVGADVENSRTSRPSQNYRPLSEEEVVERFMSIATKKKEKLVAKQQKVERKKQRKKEAEVMAKQMAEMKMQKKMEQQEMARRIAEMKLKRRVERQTAREAARRAKQMKLIEIKKLREAEKMMRQQEKVQRQEQMRVEREMRAQQMVEDRRRKKIAETIRRAKEREMKRQHQVIMKEQERERRRQHMLLVKALETRKKQEEREKAREERRARIMRERRERAEQRRLEDQVQETLRRPVEDMMLKDHQEMPEYKHVQGVRLAGAAFADALMVVEFLHTFGSALDLDPDSLPNLEELQSALLDTDVDDDDVDQLMNLTTNLLRIALNDPGFPNPRKAVTTTGEKIMDVELTDHNCSEVLRIFIKARNCKENELTELLRKRPMQAMNPTHKAAILAFLCNELLTSKAVSAEIEGHLETTQNLRRDKWTADSKMRKLRMLRARQIRKDADTKRGGAGAGGAAAGRDGALSTGDENGGGSGTGTPGGTGAPPSRRGSDDEEERDSANDSDGTNATGNVSDCEEEEGMTNEELQKKIDKLVKQQESLQKKSFDAGHKLRALELGQDRFRRRYWVLPHCGGVFVEGLESGELKENLQQEQVLLGSEVSPPKSEKEKTKGGKNDNGVVKKESDEVKQECEEKQVKTEIKQEVVMNGDVTKEEKMEMEMDQTCDKKVKVEASVISSNGDVEATKENNTNNANLNSEQTVASQTTSGKNTNSSDESSSLTNATTTANSNKFEGDAVDQLKQEELHKVRNNPGSPLTPAQRKAPPPLIKTEDLMNGSVGEGDSKLKYAKDGVVTALAEKLDSEKMMRDPKRESLPLVNGNPDLSAFKVPEGQQVSTPVFHSKFDGSYSELFNSISKHEAALHNRTVNNLSPIVHKSLNSSLKQESPAKAEGRKESSFRSIDSMLGAEPSSGALGSSPACVTSSGAALFGSGFFMAPGLMSSSSPMSAEQMLRSFSQRAASQGEHAMELAGRSSWFSILPRKPCDEFSRCSTSPPGASLGNQSVNASLDLTKSRASDFSIASLSQSSLNLDGSLGPAGSGTPYNNSLQAASMTTSPMTPGGAALTPSAIEAMKTDMLNNVQHSDPQPIPLEKQRGWWRITDPEQLKAAHGALHQRGMRERELSAATARFLEYASASCTKNKKVTHIKITDESKAIAASPVGAQDPDDPDYWIPFVAHASETTVLEEVENMEERVYTASLQVKGWKLPSKVTEDEDLELVGPEMKVTELKEHQRRTMQVARERLLALEKNVERRYLKPPFTKLVKLNLETMKTAHSGTSTRPATPGQSGNNTPQPHNEDSNSGLPGCGADLDDDADEDDDEEEQTNVPAALVRWRRAVTESESAAQLLLCAMQLNRAIAWEKSIMKVQCIICTKDDNEAQLLLCDSCDKGYHMYCFKPKITGVPDGNWYCFECISKATGEAVCVRCGKKANKLVVCDHCPRAMHMDCMEPPLCRMPRKWACWMCQLRMLKKHKKKRCKDESVSDSDASHPGTPVTAEKQRKNSGSGAGGESSSPEARDVAKRRLSYDCSDMTPCKQLMSELEKHDEAWPFLLPVNVKQFPTYRKVIKHPMDFQTMRAKLKDKEYKTHQDFAADARVVFNNCRTFNEDDSAVGRAGHAMREFFESRFQELCAPNS